MSPSSEATSVARRRLVDGCRRAAAVACGLLAIAVLSAWHRLTSSVQGADRSDSPSDADPDAAVVERELGWCDYVRAFDAHHGPDGDPDRPVQSGSFPRGLRVWAATRFLRGYTLGDEVYVCPAAPRVLRVHQAGHAPSFGREHSTLVRPRRENGGLEDAPLWTFDVMLPGEFPHTLLRLRDPRGLGETYDAWLRDGRIARVGTPEA
ncbi:hypothetical protein [Halorarius halobius]|uniref:hypothetical protein n=1 Tax=Halorarius halobius TaxID=2962671 RepID=UPI0020CEE2E5|nr:hypothetical protein [Halorarius halobius]